MSLDDTTIEDSNYDKFIKVKDAKEKIMLELYDSVISSCSSTANYEDEDAGDEDVIEIGSLVEDRYKSIWLIVGIWLPDIKWGNEPTYILGSILTEPTPETTHGEVRKNLNLITPAILLHDANNLRKEADRLGQIAFKFDKKSSTV